MGKRYILKLIMLLIGNICAAFGIFLCCISGKGVDPITVVLQGLVNTLNVSLGGACLILHVSLILICLLIDRKSIRFGTLFSIASLALFLNIFMTQYSLLSALENTSVSWLFLALGIFFMGTGFSLGIFAGVGSNTADVVLRLLTDRTKLNLRSSKTLLDFTSTSIGFALGGTFGIGTILCILLIGPIYTTTLKLLEQTKFERTDCSNVY